MFAQFLLFFQYHENEVRFDRGLSLRLSSYQVQTPIFLQLVRFSDEQKITSLGHIRMPKRSFIYFIVSRFERGDYIWDLVYDMHGFNVSCSLHCCDLQVRLVYNAH